MNQYSTSQIDKIPSCFNSINKKIEDSINELINSFDYENLRELIIAVKNEYKDLKKTVSEFSVELRINILEIEDINIFNKYKKYCQLRLKSIHKILEPQDIDNQLNIDNDKFLSHADLGKYSYFNVPEILNIYNLSGYLYTYSFMLLVLKKSIVGIVDRLEFQNSIDEDLTIFDEKKTNEESILAIIPFNISKKKGIKIDMIRILHAIYELRMIETQHGLIPTKKDFMSKMGEFFNVNLSDYDSDLSQALNNSSIEKNSEIFNKMIEIIRKSHYIDEI